MRWQPLRSFRIDVDIQACPNCESLNRSEKS
jgi:hypothetical protein